MDTRNAVMLDERLVSERDGLREQVTALMNQSATLEEGLERVQDMLRREDRGWDKLFGDSENEDSGFDLEKLKEWSRAIRPSVKAAPWIGKGHRSRANYIWQGGIKYDGVPGTKPGAGKNIRARIDLPINQRNFFGPAARTRREGCLYHDAIALWIGDDETKVLEAIPLAEISDQLRDPDHKDTIWAYQRTWTNTNLRTGKSRTMVRWYFVDAFKDKTTTQITRGGTATKVDQTKTAFDMHANRMEGHAYGSPDALAAFIWNAIARDAFMDGVTITSAMATFAFKASVSTKTGGDNASMKFARPAGAGSTAVLGATDSLVPMSSAGKAYDFNSLRALTAIIATSLDISNISLTSDPGAAGSSYGSASTLDLPTRLAMEARRLEHIELDERVLRWMGAENATAFFDSLNDASDIFREAQALLLLWSSGLYKSEPLEKRLSELLRIVGNTVPDGVLIPNNENSLPRRDIDTETKGGGTAPSKPNATPTGQGQNSPAGKGANANDIRSDGMGEMLERLNAFIAAEEALRGDRIAA